MTRAGVVLAAGALGLLGALLPTAAMLAVSYAQALREERQALRLIAERTAARAASAFGEVADALRAVERDPFEPCAPPHIARMRRIAIGAAFAEALGYYDAEGLLRCTSWGPTEPPVPRAPSDFTTADGVQVALRLPVEGGRTMIRLHLRSHGALVDPARLTDALLRPEVALAVAAGGGAPLATANAPDPAALAPLLLRDGESAEGGRLAVTVRRGIWTAAATAPRPAPIAHLREQAAVLLPAGILFGALLVGVVWWFSRRRLSLLGELRIAVRRRELVVHYQPIVELASGRTVGAEALVRWRRPDGDLTAPDLFIPAAEESGLITRITDLVVNSLVRDLGPLLVADRSLHVAVNLSAADVRTGRILPALAAALAHTGIRPDQVWLEVTERSFMHIETTRAMITEARRQGFVVAVDDFGTGYSSLSHLQQLPLDVLKIDKSFVETVGLDTATSAVTSHIIGMARSLHLLIVAEGVETAAQADYLRRHGVEYGQGFLFSRPLPPEAFVAFCRRTERGTA